MENVTAVPTVEPTVEAAASTVAVPTTDEPAVVDAAAVASGANGPSVHHTHLAFAVSYVGAPFRGSQLQGHLEPLATVEGFFLHALFRAGMTSYNPATGSRRQQTQGRGHSGGNPTFAVPAYLHFGRSSRTDKGVSALCNVFDINIKTSAWLQHGEDPERVRAALNEALLRVAVEKKILLCGVDPEAVVADGADSPSPIQILAVLPVTPSFNARFAANRRLYRYIIPAFALDPKAGDFVWPGTPVPEGSEWAASGAELVERVGPNTFAPHSWAARVGFDCQPAAREVAWQAQLEHWATTAARTTELMTRHFVGNLRFHNFTGADSKDRFSAEKNLMRDRTVRACDDEAMRKIHRIEVLPVPIFLPFLAAPDDAPKSTAAATDKKSTTLVPFYVFQIDGASFLLHMIRKIVGTVVAVMRGSREGLIADALSPEKLVETPMAPGTYLNLVRVMFDTYDSDRSQDAAHLAARFDRKEQRRQELLQAAFTGTSAAPSDVAVGAEVRLPTFSSVLLPLRPRFDHFERSRVYADMASLDQTGISLFAATLHHPQQVQQAAQQARHGMRRFVRGLRMHNWGIKENPVEFRPRTTSVDGGMTKRQQRRQRKLEWIRKAEAEVEAAAAAEEAAIAAEIDPAAAAAAPAGATIAAPAPTAGSRRQRDEDMDASDGASDSDEEVPPPVAVDPEGAGSAAAGPTVLRMAYRPPCRKDWVTSWMTPDIISDLNASL